MMDVLREGEKLGTSVGVCNRARYIPSIPGKLQLQGNIAMLLAPERNKIGLKPTPQCAEPMHTRVTCCAECNQSLRPMNAVPAVMNGQMLPRAAGTATVAVPCQHVLPVPVISPARMLNAPVAARTHSRAEYLHLAAAAKQTQLR
jgi:hypothetical protein